MFTINFTFFSLPFPYFPNYITFLDIILMAPPKVYTVFLFVNGYSLPEHSQMFFPLLLFRDTILFSQPILSAKSAKMKSLEIVGSFPPTLN